MYIWQAPQICILQLRDTLNSSFYCLSNHGGAQLLDPLSSSCDCPPSLGVCSSWTRLAPAVTAGPDLVSDTFIIDAAIRILMAS